LVGSLCCRSGNDVPVVNVDNVTISASEDEYTSFADDECTSSSSNMLLLAALRPLLLPTVRRKGSMVEALMMVEVVVDTESLVWDGAGYFFFLLLPDCDCDAHASEMRGAFEQQKNEARPARPRVKKSASRLFCVFRMSPESRGDRTPRAPSEALQGLTAVGVAERVPNTFAPES
jgi:hypothetical protein